MTDDEYDKIVASVEKLYQAALREKGALEMQAESNFVGYIREESDGRYSNDIYSYGCHNGKLFFGDSVESVKQQAFGAIG